MSRAERGDAILDAALELAADLLEARDDLLGVRRRDDPLARQHARVRDRPGDIVRQEPPVEPDRRVQLRGVRRQASFEPTTPRALGHDAKC